MSFEVVTIGDATLYLGDALEVAQAIDVKARMVMCDAPYRLTSGGSNKGPGGMSGKFAQANYDNGGEFVPCNVTWDEVAAVINSVMGADADAIVMANDKEIFKCQAALLRCGLSLHNLFAWDKITVTPNRWGMKNLEFAVAMWKGRARAFQDCGIKQLMRAPLRAVTDHPTEKPVALMKRWIEAATLPGETVCDPYMGSGTTGVAAVQGGRKFVGFEIERKWFDVACARLERALDAPELALSVA